MSDSENEYEKMCRAPTAAEKAEDDAFVDAFRGTPNSEAVAASEFFRNFKSGTGPSAFDRPLGRAGKPAIGVDFARGPDQTAFIITLVKPQDPSVRPYFVKERTKSRDPRDRPFYCIEKPQDRVSKVLVPVPFLEEFRKVSDERDALKASVRQKDASISCLTSERDALQKRVQWLERDSRFARDEAGHLKKKLDESERVVAIQAERLSYYEQKVRALLADLDALEQTKKTNILYAIKLAFRRAQVERLADRLQQKAESYRYIPGLGNIAVQTQEVADALRSFLKDTEPEPPVRIIRPIHGQPDNSRHGC